MIKLILKGILVWITIISWSIFITGGFQSLIDMGEIGSSFLWLISNIIITVLCSIFVSYDEASFLLGADWLNKKLKL